jgi:hypothetical protein
MQVKTAVSELLVTARSRPRSLPAKVLSIEAAKLILLPGTRLEGEPPADIDAIALRLGMSFSGGRTPERNDLRYAGWTIWGCKNALANNEFALAGLLEYVRAHGRKSTFRRLLTAYLISFPVGEPSLKRVARTLADQATRFAGPWTLACEDLRLFEEEEAPRRIARIGLERSWSPPRVLAEYGFKGLATEGGIAEASFLAGLRLFKDDLGAMAPLERLARAKRWMFDNQGRALFDQHRGAFVDALLTPYREELPLRQVRDPYLAFLVSHYGDPRVAPTRWMPMRLTQIVRRWLTEQSLRQFLDVVGKGAYDFQWQYRRAFWEAVHKRGLIKEAWVIFDEIGVATAKRIFDADSPFGRWSSKPTERGHACLLLKIGRGIVAEWSHNGRCYIWHDERDPAAPKLHKAHYRPSEVRIANKANIGLDRAAITHNNSDLYYWQASVADEVAKMTGQRVLESEFRI